MDKLATIKNAEFQSKKEFKLPEGATIIKEDCTIQVREIEDGFIIRKNIDLKYKLEDDVTYEYIVKEWYSKTNPISISLPKEVKSLADKLS